VSLGNPLPIALLAAAVYLSAVLALLIASVGVMPLSTPDCGSACWAAVALATVATDADSKYRTTFPLATYSQPKNSIDGSGRMRHSGIMP
jgi:hypothetical protein